MTIRRELIDELLKDYQTPQDILGEGGVLATWSICSRMMGEKDELKAHSC